jgi:hypothetical protein
MKRASECPHCGSHDTNREWLDFQTDGLVEIRTCDCETEYTNHYQLFDKDVERSP